MRLSYEFNFQEHAINITSKAKKVIGTIEKLGGVCKSISCQAIKKLYTLYVPPLNLQMEEACDRFAIRYDRAVSLNNPIWRLANGSKPAECDLEKLFARVKQMNDMYYDKYWRKYSPWKQLKYGHYMKSHEAFQKLKGILHVASRGE